jgi:ribosomal protein S11
MQNSLKSNLNEGICYITIGKSNLIFSVTDLNGNQLMWLRPTNLKFRGSKQRFSAFAMEQTVFRLVKNLRVINLIKLHFVFSGFFRKWIGRAIGWAFRKQHITFLSYKYRIARPHGLMRPKKKRRL